MEREMGCCNLLTSGAKKAFICKECSKEKVVLCEDCSLMCHPLHKVSEIIIAKAQKLYCDCGNSRAVNKREICLLNRNKPSVNPGNRYNFRLADPKYSGRLSSEVDLEYNRRRCELLERGGPLYLERARLLAERGCFIDAMKDVCTAIAWDLESVIIMIINIDLGAATSFLLGMTADCIKQIKSEEAVQIMLFAEIAVRVFERVERAFSQTLMRINGEDAVGLKVKALIAAFNPLKESLMDAVWDRAASAGALNITSPRQFDLYQRFVKHRSKQMAVLNLKKEDFEDEDWSKILDGHGTTYLIAELMK